MICWHSWDRVPYLTPCRNEKGSTVSATRHIKGNLILATYNSQEAVDNDDGSARYLTEGNVLMYGQYGMKSDFGGWLNHHEDNLYAYVCSCFGEGTNNTFANNTCVVRGGGGCYFWYALCAMPHGHAATSLGLVMLGLVMHSMPCRTSRARLSHAAA